MAYIVTKYDGSNLTIVPDNVLDTTTTSITLIGKNAVNFGLALNENFVALMQHFANSSPPPSPIQGQIWFNSVDSSLQVWTGTKWVLVTPPFVNNAGTATVVIPTPDGNVEVVAIISDGIIVSVVSNQSVAPAYMSDTVMISDTSFAFKLRFPYGLSPGVNLAVDANGYQFNGIASKANVLSTSRNISINGSVTGNVMFDGSNDVVITSNLINVFNANISTDVFYSKVLMSSNGLVTDANVLIDQDIYTALGYTPPAIVVLEGDATGQTTSNGTVFSVNVSLSNTNVNPGTYNNVTVDSAGRVVQASVDYPIPIRGIILIDDIIIPNGWTLCDGTTVDTVYGQVVTPNIPPVGTARYIMKIY